MNNLGLNQDQENELRNNLNKFKQQMIKTEYFRELRKLLNNVNWTLKSNPHNLFVGTAKQYIRKYSLHTQLKYAIIKKWTF